MYILIVNEDPLGRRLAEILVKNGHEVAYLDADVEYCNQIASELGCLTIHGETTNINILQEAGIERADVVIALHQEDIKNIMVGIFARQFSVPKIMARLRQEHYASAYELAGVADVFSEFDFLLNKMLIAIENPHIKQVMRLGNGQTEIASLDLAEDSPLVGQPLSAVWEHPDYPHKALVLGLIKEEDQVVHLPREQPTVEKRDFLIVVGSPEDVHRISAYINNQRRW